MARPRKMKKICLLPEYRSFEAEGAEQKPQEPLVMTVEEYETLRLIDLEGMTQEACSAEMQIARTTVQGIYASARRKLADFLVNGKKLHIQGGEYRLCGGCGGLCGRPRCCWPAGQSLPQTEQPALTPPERPAPAPHSPTCCKARQH